MHFFIEHLPQMGFELFLGVCIKLFCDHGRIQWQDFANDALFWLPSQRPAAQPEADAPLAAK